MTTAAIEYIWQAILESEQSDEVPYMNPVAWGMPPARSDAPDRKAVPGVVNVPLQAPGDPLLPRADR